MSTAQDRTGRTFEVTPSVLIMPADRFAAEKIEVGRNPTSAIFSHCAFYLRRSPKALYSFRTQGLGISSTLSLIWPTPMITFRCTQKTRDLFGLKDRDLVEKSAGDFWEWFVSVATFDRRRCLLFTHKVSLYSFWAAGVGKASVNEIEALFRQHLAATMQLDGFNEDEVARLFGDGGHAFSKTNSRPVIGSMNDHIFATEHYVNAAGGLAHADLGEICRRLNKTPMRAIGVGSDMDLPIDVLSRSLRPGGPVELFSGPSRDEERTAREAQESTTTKPLARDQSPGATMNSGRAAARKDFDKLIELITAAKERGVFDAKNRPRTFAKPTVVNTPGAAFARIVPGAKTEDQQLRALEAAAQNEVALPAEASVVGEPVTAGAITYSGHPRAGLTLWCVRGHRHFSVALSDVAFPPGSDGAQFVSLYRSWLGFGELPSEEPAVGNPVELVVLACKSNALRCRLLGTTREVTLRTAVRDEVPGGIISVIPTKEWTHARHTYLAGNVLSIRADVEALRITPLALHQRGQWDPEAEDWGEEGDPIEEWAKPIIARGKRPMFEMEQVLPGIDPEDFDSDPIVEASELNAAGDRAGAREVLMKLLAQDLRCLDAHAHLGNFEFDHRPEQALRHYEIGMSIGAFSLGKRFDGVLAWGLIDNRPFLRCLHGVGLCAWRLGEIREATAVFRKMLWLNPSDNQGARFNLAAVEAGRTWKREQ